MDHMLPSPGFNIPSIGTPLHQPEEDLILPQAHHQQHLGIGGPHHGGMGHSMSMGLGLGGSSVITSYSGGLSMTPHSLMQPQTPVSSVLHLRIYRYMQVVTLNASCQVQFLEFNRTVDPGGLEAKHKIISRSLRASVCIPYSKTFCLLQLEALVCHISP
jgi:hypothetical protein